MHRIAKVREKQEMKPRKKIPGIRFRKRLGTAILAAVMIVSSIQLPGGKSYAAGLTGSGMEDKLQQEHQ